MQPSEKKTTPEADGDKPIRLRGTVALTPSPAPGIDDPWGRLDAAQRAFARKAQTHPEHAPAYLDIAAILPHLRDRELRHEIAKLIRRHLGEPSGRHGPAYLAAQTFADSLKGSLLADSLREASERVLRTLEATPLLWAPREKHFDRGPKRPARLDLETVEDALREAYAADRDKDDDRPNPVADFRAAGALALTAEHDPAQWQDAFNRFHNAIDGEALAKKVLRAVEVEHGWDADLYE